MGADMHFDPAFCNFGRADKITKSLVSGSQPPTRVLFSAYESGAVPSARPYFRRGSQIQ